VAEIDLDYSNFFETMAQEVPEFRNVYDEHVSWNHEVLPHVLMGDVTPMVLSLCRVASSRAEGAETARDMLVKILALLDRGMGAADKRLQELVSVSFLEGLKEEADECYEQLTALMGPRLLAELEHQESWSPEKEQEKWGDYPYDG